MLYEGLKESSTIVIVPSTAEGTMQRGGLAGMTALTSAHPRFCWNDHCTPRSEWLKFTKNRRPKDRLWTASDEKSSLVPV